MIKKIKETFKKHKIRKAQRKELLESLKTSFDHGVISWYAPEYTKWQKGILWHIIAILVAIVGIYFSFLAGERLFALTILVFVIVYYVVHHREDPRSVEVKISDVGIKVGGRKYPFSHIRSFWILYDPPFVQSLNIHVKDNVMVNIAIELGSQDPAVIREFLIDRIPEITGKSEPLTDSITRLFRI